MKLGFIGFGEVGFELARGLNKEGVSEIVAFDPMAKDSQYGKLVSDRAREACADVLRTSLDVVQQADIIISVVPGSKALQVALDIVPVITGDKIYVDVSTSPTTTKKRIAEALWTKGARFVDAALMGGLSVYHHKVPTLVSGSGSDEFIRLLTPYGMSMTKVSDVAGDAIAIKLVRSIAMKGLASLAVETLEAAVALNVQSEVLKSISATLTSAPFDETLDWLVTASAIHAERQVHEMQDVMIMMKEIDVEPTMTDATTKRLEWLVSKNYKARFQGKKPDTWEEVAAGWVD
jgi:3-hydroxyisobutyrate dehydrogenase-like beta-hydroxyacid dehydrogenase